MFLHGAIRAIKKDFKKFYCIYYISGIISIPSTLALHSKSNLLVLLLYKAVLTSL